MTWSRSAAVCLFSLPGCNKAMSMGPPWLLLSIKGRGFLLEDSTPMIFYYALSTMELDREQAWDTLTDIPDNSSIDKIETSLVWREYFSQFQDSTAVLLYHIYLPVHLWIIDPPTAELQRKIQTMEMRCYHKILRFSYKDNVTHSEVRAKIQHPGPHKYLLMIIKRGKLQQ